MDDAEAVAQVGRVLRAIDAEVAEVKTTLPKPRSFMEGLADLYGERQFRMALLVATMSKEAPDAS